MTIGLNTINKGSTIRDETNDLTARVVDATYDFEVASTNLLMTGSVIFGYDPSTGKWGSIALDENDPYICVTLPRYEDVVGGDSPETGICLGAWNESTYYQKVYGTQNHELLVYSNLGKIGGTDVAVNSGAVNDGTLRVVHANDASIPVSKDTNPNTVSNPLFSTLTNGTNQLGASYPLAVSANDTANATDNRFFVNSNVDMLGGNTISLGSGAAGPGTLRVIHCTDDPVLTPLQLIDDWDEVHDSAVGTDGALIMAEARSSLGTAVANGDASRFITDLYGRMVPANFTFATQSCRVEEIDPLSEKYIGETLAAVTDGPDDTYYYYVDMGGYTTLSAQLILSGGSGTCTVTVEGTVQDDGTAPASITNWIDVSNDLYGAASWTASDMLYDTNRIGGQFKYLRFKVVASTGDADDADWTIYSKRMWC